MCWSATLTRPLSQGRAGSCVGQLVHCHKGPQRGRQTVCTETLRHDHPGGEAGQARVPHTVGDLQRRDELVVYLNPWPGRPPEMGHFAAITRYLTSCTGCLLSKLKKAFLSALTMSKWAPWSSSVWMTAGLAGLLRAAV